jgi:type VI secretion system secreted protein VgrG
MPIPVNAEVRFLSPLADQLLFHHMEVEEELGRPFKYDLTLLSERGDLVLGDLLGQVVTIELDLPGTTPTPNDGIRYFNGYVTRFSRQGAHRKYHVYSATVRPWLWLLTQTSNCRIFQEKTVPDIIKEVFRGHGLTDFQESLTSDYSPREYVVQYRETDFNFVNRLMEHEGIYYFFKHEAAKHTLVLADSSDAHATVKGYETIPYIRPGTLQQALPDHIDDWEISQQIEPGTVILNDFNFRTPKASLLSKRSAPNAHAKADFEDYDYPGNFLKGSEGEVYANLRLEELNARYQRTRGSSNARGMTVGSLFETANLPIDSDNGEYLLLASTMTIEGPDYESQGGRPEGELFRCSFVAIDSKCPFRPERSTPRPTVSGLQTATVVGQSGEEIWTDEYGRVKVQFHWDREGQRDQNSSCWVRVAQVWAGAQWGAMHIPRIGQEVIVGFLEGDPDQPIITGRVYNAVNMPPYTLPDKKTQSGIKSRSSKGGSSSNFNEIRFEDLKGQEELHLQAEKDMSTLVKNNQSASVGVDRSLSVGSNETVSIGKNRTETVGTNEKIDIGSNRTETVGADESVTIGANQTLTVGSNRTKSVGGNESITIAAASSETVGATRSVTIAAAYQLTVGGAINETVGAAKAEEIGGAKSVNVGAASSESVGGKKSVSAGGAISVSSGAKIDVTASSDIAQKAGKNFVIEAADQVSIKCGSATLVMKKNGDITINGNKISVKGDGDLVLKGSKIGQN